MTARLRELAERWKANDGHETLYAIGRRDAQHSDAAELLSILDAEGDGGADFGESDGVALRSVKVGETLTESQWNGICQFVRHQDSIIRGLREALRNPARSDEVSDEDVRDAARYREQMSKHYMRHPNQLIDVVRYANQFRPDWWMDKESWDAGIDFAIDAAIQGERHE